MMSGFDYSVLGEQLDKFELGWQYQRWGENEEEKWVATGDLGTILGDLRRKWGNTL